ARCKVRGRPAAGFVPASRKLRRILTSLTPSEALSSHTVHKTRRRASSTSPSHLKKRMLGDMHVDALAPAGTFIRCSSENPLSLADGVWNVLKEVSQGATKIPSMGLGSFCSESEMETVWQRTQSSGFDSHLEQVLLGVQDPDPGSQEASELYRIPVVTGLDLLSPGSQALVPCCRGEPRTIKELPLC
ncbi:hypothetical protein PIB30_063929, partial [Stylosanthes scabra]|nr:hypothetical protein [Stylosanthes scabra]